MRMVQSLDTNFCVRMSQKDLARLTELAADLGMGRAQTIRYLIITEHRDRGLGASQKVGKKK